MVLSLGVHVFYHLPSLKKVNLPDKAIEFLNFVPIVIMSALWFENLFIQRLGQLPELNIPNLLASIPTLLAAIFFKKFINNGCCWNHFTRFNSINLKKLAEGSASFLFIIIFDIVNIIPNSFNNISH